MLQSAGIYSDCLLPRQVLLYSPWSLSIFVSGGHKYSERVHITSQYPRLLYNSLSLSTFCLSRAQIRRELITLQPRVVVQFSSLGVFVSRGHKFGESYYILVSSLLLLSIVEVE